MLEVADNGPAV